MKTQGIDKRAGVNIHSINTMAIIAYHIRFVLYGPEILPLRLLVGSENGCCSFNRPFYNRSEISKSASQQLLIRASQYG